MPSFLVRGLARYIAASVMESKAKETSFRSSEDNANVSTSDLSVWKTDMRWLIPFVQATGYCIVIENPKSHEKFTIDPNTEELPPLTIKWMKKYNKQELLEWMEQEKNKKKARKLAEVRGRTRFGRNYTPTDQDIQDVCDYL